MSRALPGAHEIEGSLRHLLSGPLERGELLVCHRVTASVDVDHDETTGMLRLDVRLDLALVHVPATPSDLGRIHLARGTIVSLEGGSRLASPAPRPHGALPDEPRTHMVEAAGGGHPWSATSTSGRSANPAGARQRDADQQLGHSHGCDGDVVVTDHVVELAGLALGIDQEGRVDSVEQVGEVAGRVGGAHLRHGIGLSDRTTAGPAEVLP